MTKRSLLNTFRASFFAFFTIALVLGIVTRIPAQGHEHKVEFYLDGKVGNELVKRGSYTIAYPEADQGTLQIKAGKKVISTSFTRQKADSPSDVDKMTYRENADGSRVIDTITPRGKKYTLILQ